MKRLLTLFWLLPSLAFAADANWLEIEASPFAKWSTASFAYQDIAATNDSLEFVFRCKEAATITDIGILLGTHVGTPCATTVALEGVNMTTGRADGTIKSSTNAKLSFTPGTSDNVWAWKTLGASYTCTRGELLSVVLFDTSDGCTPNGSNKHQYAYMNNNWPGTAFPYSITVPAGTGTFHAGIVPFAFKSASAVYGNPISTITAEDFGQDSTPDERGNIFTIPCTWLSTFQVGGVRMFGYLNMAGGTAEVRLYQGTTVLQNVVLDGDLTRGAGSSGVFDIYFDETTLSTLSCGTAYRITLMPLVNGGTKSGLTSFSVSAAADMGAYVLGTSMTATTRTDTGAFSETTTKRYYTSPLIKDITAPSGGGIAPGFNKAFN